MSIFPVVGVLHVGNSPLLVYVQYIKHDTAQDSTGQRYGTVQHSSTAVQQYSTVQ